MRDQLPFGSVRSDATNSPLRPSVGVAVDVRVGVAVGIVVGVGVVRTRTNGVGVGRSRTVMYIFANSALSAVATILTQPLPVSHP